ncbi:MAG: CmcI family methyltransferase, partial [Acidimicrobiales bacterium]
MPAIQAEQVPAVPPGRSGGRAKLAKMLRMGLGEVRAGDFSRLGIYYRRCVRPGRLRRVVRSYRRRFRMTLRAWLDYHQSDVVFEGCSWMGVPVWKNPLDAWIYQEIVHEVRPDVIVELGSAAGGSALYLAHLLELLGHGTVVSVDVDRSTFVAEHERLVTVTGPSSAPETVARVAELCRGKRALVIHDADHTKEQVLVDLRCYAPFVGVGSYLIVEDGIVDLFRPWERLGVTYEGPLGATEEFLRTTDEFEVDSGRERYVLTANPRGFLRRAR